MIILGSLIVLLLIAYINKKWMESTKKQKRYITWY